MSIEPARPDRIRELLHWSPEAPVTARALAVAVLGMSVPVIVGMAFGQPRAGFTIGLGAMLLAGETPAGATPTLQDRPSPLGAIVPAALAVSLATVMAGTPITYAVMIVLAGLAATISGYNRPVAIGAIRFLVYLVLSVTLLDGASNRSGAAALVFGLGALWNITIRVLLRERKPRAPVDAPPVRVPTHAQYRARWRKSLAALEGWQFALRIVVGLAAAVALKLLFPSHHYGWIVLTVALLTQRPIEHLPVKLLQRSLGAVLGVGLTWVMLVAAPPPILLAALICLFAAGAVLSRTRNYLAYSALSTPVILIVLDFGKPVETTLLVDRLVATLAGAAIVIALNAVLDRLIRMIASQMAPARTP